MFTNKSAPARIVLDSRNNNSQIYFSTKNTNLPGVAERMRINKDGNVGIGTDNPRARLEVTSVIKSTPTNSPGTCDVTLEGAMYYDASLNEPCYCNGSNWLPFDGTGTC